jgi:hypothetical protein
MTRLYRQSKSINTGLSSMEQAAGQAARDAVP